MSDPVTAPDLNGCTRCGRLKCRVSSTTIAYQRLTAASSNKEIQATFEVLMSALQECGMHPAVDWQAECRRLAAPAWRREPPTVEEVEAGVKWWWLRVAGANERPVRAWVDVSFQYDTDYVHTDAGIAGNIHGSWAPCLPPTGDVSE